VNEWLDAATDGGICALAEPARGLVSEPAWNYLAGGSGDNHTLRRNIERWAALSLAPRMLVDVAKLDTRLRLLGHDLEAPVLIAPTASHGLFHPGAEVETAQGAAAARSLFVASTGSTLRVEDIGSSSDSPWWFQLYVQRDRAFTRDLVGRAERAGASALALTVDLPMQAPGTAARREALNNLTGAVYGNLAGLDPAGGAPSDPQLDPALTWADIGWLRSLTTLPVLVKGVLRPDDAARAVDDGVAGVIVSNHGGRALDTTPATRPSPSEPPRCSSADPSSGGLRSAEQPAYARSWTRCVASSRSRWPCSARRHSPT
jgi:4-hydroxymandelate oxidase